MLPKQSYVMVHFKDKATVSIEISTNSTIKQLKDKIASIPSIQIPTERQRLFYRGKEVINDDTLSSLNIDIGSPFLMADLAPSQKAIDTKLWIEAEEEERFSIMIDVKRGFVCDLMNIIVNRYNLQKEHYRLVFKGKVLDDSAFLNEYRLKKGSTLVLTSNSWADGAGPVNTYSVHRFISFFHFLYILHFLKYQMPLNMPQIHIQSAVRSFH